MFGQKIIFLIFFAPELSCLTFVSFFLGFLSLQKKICNKIIFSLFCFFFWLARNIFKYFEVFRNSWPAWIMLSPISFRYIRKLIIMFNFLFLDMPSILVGSFSQNPCYMDIIFLYQISVFSYCWPFPWINCPTRSWNLVTNLTLFYYFPDILCSP